MEITMNAMDCYIGVLRLQNFL